MDARHQDAMNISVNKFIVCCRETWLIGAMIEKTIWEFGPGNVEQQDF